MQENWRQNIAEAAKAVDEFQCARKILGKWHPRAPEALASWEHPSSRTNWHRRSTCCIGDLEIVYMGDLNGGEASDPARAGDPRIIDWTVISAFDQRYQMEIGRAL